MNQVVVVGRLTRDVEVHKSENGVKVATITLAINRSFRNIEGNYETDFIDFVAFDLVATNTALYCHKGDIVGIKGRLQSKIIEKDDKKENHIDIIAEKVTFLSSKQNENEEKKNKKDKN